MLFRALCLSVRQRPSQCSVGEFILSLLVVLAFHSARGGREGGGGGGGGGGCPFKVPICNHLFSVLFIVPLSLFLFSTNHLLDSLVKIRRIFPCLLSMTFSSIIFTLLSEPSCKMPFFMAHVPRISRGVIPDLPLPRRTPNH